MAEAQASCLLCERVRLGREGRNPMLIHEFAHSLFVLGDHQFHPGYSLVLLKEHVRELHDLPPDIQTALFLEVMAATRAIVRTFRPWKMNHSCYGNQVPHVHWHLFPRYDTMADHLQQPWLHAAEFDRHPTEPAAARDLIRRIRENLKED